MTFLGVTHTPDTTWLQDTSSWYSQEYRVVLVHRTHFQSKQVPVVMLRVLPETESMLPMSPCSVSAQKAVCLYTKDLGEDSEVLAEPQGKKRALLPGSHLEGCLNICR